MRGFSAYQFVFDDAKLRIAEDYILEGIASGDFKMNIAKTFALDDIRAAHQYMESNNQVGKIIVIV